MIMFVNIETRRNDRLRAPPSKEYHDEMLRKFQLVSILHNMGFNDLISYYHYYLVKSKIIKTIKSLSP